MYIATLLIIIGLSVGAAARLLSGKRPGGWAMPVLLGVSGAIGGGLIGQWLRLQGWFGVFVLPLLCALIAVIVYHALVYRSRQHSR